MDYVSGGSKGENGVLKVEEQAALAYAAESGSAAAGWGGVDVEDIDAGIDLDDDEAFEAEVARLEGILIERGILKPEDRDVDLDDLDGPEELQPKNMEELYRMLEESRADVLAGRVYSTEELDRELRREELADLRRMLENGHV
jgi:hypothetical protein